MEILTVATVNHRRRAPRVPARLALILVSLLAISPLGCRDARTTVRKPREALLALAAWRPGYGGPGEAIEDEAKIAGKTKEDFPPDDFDYFRKMDQAVPKDQDVPSALELAPLLLSPAEVRGRNTWMMWTGGNEAFWDWMANNSPGFVDLLKLLEFSPDNRWPRFQQAGLIVEPDTVVPTQADRYGLYIRQPKSATTRRPDEARFGRSSGIVGLRLFDNPNFDAGAAKRWDPDRYRSDPSYYLDPTLVRPYRVGMSCGFCHVGPHPLNPPAPEHVEEPGWENLSATIGNQYLRTRAVFTNLLTPDNYYYHLLDSELPGTLDTALIPSDGINNASAMNAIFELGARLDRAGIFDHHADPEQARRDYEGEGDGKNLKYGTLKKEAVGKTAATKWPVLFYGTPDAYAKERPVPRVLMDGSDSAGPWASLARVYLNIGTYHQKWITLHNPLFGLSAQRPFAMADAAEHSVYWAATEALMDDLARYLVKASAPTRLRNAPSDEAQKRVGPGVPWAPGLEAGRKVFAERCIVCHSSKQPPLFDQTRDADVLTLLKNESYTTWAKAEVEKPEFWRDNYLSTDRRLPVTLVGTNAARALGTNAMKGHLWEEFSSKDYKSLPSVRQIDVWNPFSSKAEKFAMPDGGRGYYRPATLVSIWATAPFLHNNSVGDFNNDPSVEGRLQAFDDAIAKLLAGGDDEPSAARARWRQGSRLNGADARRLEQDHGLIWRLPREAQFRLPLKQLPVLVERVLGWRFGEWIIPLLLSFVIVGALIGPRWSRRWAAPLLLAATLFLGWRFGKWIIPFILFLVVVAVLVGSRWRRRAAPPLLAATFFFAVLASGGGGIPVDVSLRLPAGLPADLMANLDFDKIRTDVRNWAPGLRNVIRLLWDTDPSSPSSINRLGLELDELGRNKDHVMDRGHYFGVRLSEQQRKDLIALLLTF